jgi:hypothetical protein
MPKIKILIFISIIIINTASCAVFSRTDGFKMLKIKHTVLMYPELGSRSPKLKFEAVLPRPSTIEQNTLFAKSLYNGLDCADYAGKSFNNVKNKYFDAKPVGETIVESAGLNWEYVESYSARSYGDIVVMERKRFIFSGGAHPENEKEYFVFNIKSNRQLRLENIIPQKNHAELRRALIDAVKLKYKNSNSEINGVYVPSENFFVTPQGLGFAWTSYSIAPGYFGIIEVELGWNELKDILSGEGRSLAGTLRSSRQTQKITASR